MTMYKDIINNICKNIHTGLVDFDEPRSEASMPTQATSEFITNKQQGDWAEDVIFRAINDNSDSIVAVRYGKSDDLVAYFASKTALSLMLLDEYGSVQQHLQPRHIQEMLVPVPDDWSLAKDMINAGNKFIQAMESMSKADFDIREHGFDKMCYTECPCSE